MVSKKKVIAIIQARLSSSRLPAKVMLDLNGKTVLERVVERVQMASQVDEIWLSTSDHRSDDILADAGKKIGIRVYRGSLNNVYKRFCQTINESTADVIVRVTADNPLTEPTFIDNGIKTLINENLDYLIYEEAPYGTAIEVIKSSTLLDLGETVVLTDEELEHVTLFIRNNFSKFNARVILPEMKFRCPDIRVTLDTFEDYMRLHKIFNQFKDKLKDSNLLSEIISYLKHGNH